MRTEKRRHPRYKRATMSLSVARPGIAGFLQLNPSSECMNFSRSGLQFESSQPFKAEEKLVVDLDVWDIHLKDINAIVVQCKKHDKGTYCTGIKFCFDAKRMQTNIITTGLLKIEDNLRLATAFPT